MKAKLARNKRAREKTGGGAAEEEPLTAIEELYAKTVFDTILCLGHWYFLTLFFIPSSLAHLFTYLPSRNK